MMDNDPITKLEAFYEDLNSIPTPNLIPTTSGWRGMWVFLVTPLAASLCAYGFILFCTTGPVGPPESVPLQIPVDQYALAQLRAEMPTPVSPLHVFNDRKFEAMA